MLSGRGLCDGLITHPEQPYQMWRVVVCGQETLKTRRLKPANGLWKIQPQWVVMPGKPLKTANFSGMKALFLKEEECLLLGCMLTIPSQCGRMQSSISCFIPYTHTHINFSNRGQSVCAGYTKYSQTHYKTPWTVLNNSFSYWAVLFYWGGVLQ